MKTSPRDVRLTEYANPSHSEWREQSTQENIDRWADRAAKESDGHKHRASTQKEPTLPPTGEMQVHSTHQPAGHSGDFYDVARKTRNHEARPTCQTCAAGPPKLVTIRKYRSGGAVPRDGGGSAVEMPDVEGDSLAAPEPAPAVTSDTRGRRQHYPRRMMRVRSGGHLRQSRMRSDCKRDTPRSTRSLRSISSRKRWARQSTRTRS